MAEKKKHKKAKGKRGGAHAVQRPAASERWEVVIYPWTTVRKATRTQPRTPLGDDEGYVYLIESTDVGYVKIGWSRTPEARLGQLQTGSLPDLRLLAAIRGERKLEGQLHTWFADRRLDGEWFLFREGEDAVELAMEATAAVFQGWEPD
ncbi:GIY-YIG nuclease family protein [Streptomyces sp. NPDC048659]|uniref:GIY-YIG nuclease family protein n=1 Tax=Streptomyces sp. NPDC048659 TaxID=3155489 RepID=UPI00344776B5